MRFISLIEVLRCLGIYLVVEFRVEGCEVFSLGFRRCCWSIGR